MEAGFLGWKKNKQTMSEELRELLQCVSQALRYRVGKTESKTFAHPSAARKVALGSAGIFVLVAAYLSLTFSFLSRCLYPIFISFKIKIRNMMANMANSLKELKFLGTSCQLMTT